MSLMDRLKKTSRIEIANVLGDSEIFGERQNIPTEVPIINVALSGSLRGGLTSGVTMIAGPSKHFKTGMAMLLIRAFLNAHPKDGAILFYDSEFGSPPAYFNSFGIDMTKVFHTPITNIEELKHDIMVQLKEAKRHDPLMIIIDSIGQLASIKEVEDAIEGKQVLDMTRAKAFKSLFRMITPHLRIKDIPLVVVNHSYKTLEMYSKDIPGGGTGGYFAADTIWIVGRKQEKVKDELSGYEFILNSEKSRYVKEKSKFPVSVSFDFGIDPYSGLLENALEAGFVTKPNDGWYLKKGDKTRLRAADTNNAEFWKDILADEEFNEFIKKKYEVAHGSILASTEPDDDEAADEGK